MTREQSKNEKMIDLLAGEDFCIVFWKSKSIKKKRILLGGYVMEQLKCPNCGASIMMNEENNFLFCPYCGSKMPQKQSALDKILKHDRHKMQFNEEVRQRKVKEKVEAEAREKKDENTVLIVCLILLVAVGVVIFFGIRGENNTDAELKALVAEIQTDLEAGNYDIALFKAEQLHWPHGDTDGQLRWEKERAGLIRVIKEAKKNAGK